MNAKGNGCFGSCNFSTEFLEMTSRSDRCKSMDIHFLNYVSVCVLLLGHVPGTSSYGKRLEGSMLDH